MKRRNLGISVAVAGLLAGSFLAGGLLLSSGGSNASGNEGSAGANIVTPTVTVDSNACGQGQPDGDEDADHRVLATASTSSTRPATGPSTRTTVVRRPATADRALAAVLKVP